MFLQVALEKLYCYASGHVFESEVAGKMCADMCSAASKVDPASTLKCFLPYCLHTIETILTGKYLIPTCMRTYIFITLCVHARQR